MDAVANRVKRVACGWEAELAISVEDILSMPVVFELVQAFCEARSTLAPVHMAPGGGRKGAVNGGGEAEGPATRLRLRTDVLVGTWEALVTGAVDLAIGVSGEHANPGGIELRPLGEVPFVFCVAPHHRLAAAEEPLTDALLVHHRAIAVADTAQRLAPLTINLLPGQDVLTVPHMRAKLEAQLRGLGCGFVPEPMARAHIEAGHLVMKRTVRTSLLAPLFYAWRAERGPLGMGRALAWWIEQLNSPVTRRALIERHAGRLV
jgi:DNA-binding transcriptional LysR family regulator